MGIKKILVPLSGRHDPGDPASLDAPAQQSAVKLARRLDALAEVLCVISPASPEAAGWISWMPNYGMESVLDAIEKQGRIRRRNARKSYDALVAPEVRAGGLRAAFVEREGDIGRTVGAVGRLADLIVVANSQTRWEQPFRPILDAALRETARPVFVAPPVAPETVGDNVTIAWNDSVEASRALAGALPLLQKARSVTVLTCREEGQSSERADPEAVVAYLELHGVKAKSAAFQASHRHVAREIIDAALAQGSDLLVLGSVIHSRAHSLIYGSLTEEVLKAPRLSALLVP